MKITKEEKHLYKYLKTIFDIQKTSSQKYIIGHYGFLYFWTPYRCGKFYQKSDERIAMEYNFNDYSSYAISQLPDGDFELKENDAISKEEMIDYMDRINYFMKSSKFVYEFDKNDICQLAKMTFFTQKMLCDEDLKYFNRFKDVEIYQSGDHLLADSNIVDEGLNVHITLIFDTSSHEAELQTQTSLPKSIKEDNEYEDNEEVLLAQSIDEEQPTEIPVDYKVEKELEKDAENAQNIPFEEDGVYESANFDLDEEEPF